MIVTIRFTLLEVELITSFTKLKVLRALPKLKVLYWPPTLQSRRSRQFDKVGVSANWTLLLTTNVSAEVSNTSSEDRLRIITTRAFDSRALSPGSRLLGRNESGRTINVGVHATDFTGSVPSVRPNTMWQRPPKSDAYRVPVVTSLAGHWNVGRWYDQGERVGDMSTVSEHLHKCRNVLQLVC